jgi:hypothetical protein
MEIKVAPLQAPANSLAQLLALEQEIKAGRVPVESVPMPVQPEAPQAPKPYFAPPPMAPAPSPPAPQAAPAPGPAAPAPSAPPAVAVKQARLTLKRGGALSNESFPFSGRVGVGRFDVDSGPVDVDLGPLPEAVYLSRRHLEIWSDASSQWKVKDLGSQNGTFLKAAGAAQFQRVTQETPINDGDEIALGNARFEFRVD